MSRNSVIQRNNYSKDFICETKEFLLKKEIPELKDDRDDKVNMDNIAAIV